MFTDIYISIIVLSLIALLRIAKQKHEITALLAYYVVGVSMYFIIDVESNNHYYVLMCFTALLVAIFIHNEFKVAAICAYLLVPVNVLGYFLWYKYYPHDLYNVISAILLIIQFLSILPKALLNGMGRTSNRYPVDVCTGFDGSKEYDTMHKRPKTQEDKK